MIKLVFYVPPDHAEAVKQALFAAGAGRYEKYDSCAYETRGTGQFRPLDGSSPFIGRAGEVERVEELRVEMICRDEVARAAVATLLEAHPYEEPAYEVYRIWTADDLPAELP
ncbi:MAG: NGG1p interacting factor NIF3 [Spirochaetota bacterium]